jgi:hypothetical protein
VTGKSLPSEATDDRLGGDVLGDTLQIGAAPRLRQYQKAQRRITRDGTKIYVGGKWRQISTQHPSNEGQRTQLRKLLQLLIDGPILNADRINQRADILAAFKSGGAAP